MSLRSLRSGTQHDNEDLFLADGFDGIADFVPQVKKIVGSEQREVVWRVVGQRVPRAQFHKQQLRAKRCDGTWSQRLLLALRAFDLLNHFARSCSHRPVGVEPQIGLVFAQSPIDVLLA